MCDVRYAVLIYDRAGLFESLTAEERERLLGDYMALTQEPPVVEWACLEPVETARTVTLEGGRPLTTDGPFADTKEVFGGFYVVDVGLLEDAVEFAARVPAARMGGLVEVRPLVHLGTGS
jgi:hypothetical protein